MLRLLLFHFWPIWLPPLLYLLWWLIARSKAKKSGLPMPAIKDGSWVWVLLVSLSLGIILFVYLGMSNEPVDGEYAPAQIIDGKIVDGHFDTPTSDDH